MTLPAPVYDLTMLLDLQAEEPVRAKALADTLASIEARGELVRNDEWGERPLAYPILKRKSADYHLLQFHTDDKELLSSLERTLHITDGVLRFRLIKLRPGVGAPPDMRSGAPAPAARRTEPERGDAEASGAEASAVETAAVETAAAETGSAEAASEAAPVQTPAVEAPASETETPAAAAEAPAAPEAPAEAASPAEGDAPAEDGEPSTLQESTQA